MLFIHIGTDFLSVSITFAPNFPSITSLACLYCEPETCQSLNLFTPDTGFLMPFRHMRNPRKRPS